MPQYDGEVVYAIRGDNSQYDKDINQSKITATAAAVAIGAAFVEMSKKFLPQLVLL